MSWQHLSTTAPVARKDHRCIWCGNPVLKGEKHILTTGIYEGNFQSNRMHAECDTVASKWFKETFEEGFDPYRHKRGSLEEK